MATNREDVFIPADPITMVEGPHSGGIILNSPPHKLDETQVLDASNFTSGPEGLTRRPAKLKLYDGQTFSYPPAQGMCIFWDNAGASYLGFIDEKYFYIVSAGTITHKAWSYVDGTPRTITIAGTTVTASGDADWNTYGTSRMKAGDIFVVDPNGSDYGPTEVEISSITNDTTLELVSAPGATGPGEDYAVYHAFGAGEPDIVDYCWMYYGNTNLLLFADGFRDLYKYDGTNFTEVGNNGYYPIAVAWFKDRVWIGNITEGAVHYRQRLRYSNVGDPTTWGANDYEDRPYTVGSIQRLVPLSDTLAVYFTTGIEFGYPTQDADHPLNFKTVDTGGIGLIGSRAIVPWMDTHFFVGQDDIYALSSRGYQKIGTPVVKSTLKQCEHPWRIYGTIDPNHDRVLFGFPESEQAFSKVWAYNYKSNSWSYDEIGGYTLGTYSEAANLSWGDLAGYGAWSDLEADFPTWGSFQPIQSSDLTTYVLSSSEVYYYIDGTADQGSISIPASFVTRDLDHGAPNQDKTWYRISLKIKEPADSDIEFAVRGSVDGGNTWKELTEADLGLKIRSGKLEGHCNFRLTGPQARFEFTTTAAHLPFTVTQLALRVGGKGLDITREAE